MSEAGAHWDARYRAGDGPDRAAPWLDELALSGVLPPPGSMVDIAGGTGRNAVWFARRSYAATVIDVSGEALTRAGANAARAGVTVELIQRDLDVEGLPAGRLWDVALMHRYSSPAVLSALPDHLHAGGILLFSQPTVANLERHARPGRRFLLAPGEVTELAVGLTDVEIIEASEGWRANGCHEARLVARRT